MAVNHWRVITLIIDDFYLSFYFRVFETIISFIVRIFLHVRSCSSYSFARYCR